MASGHHNKPLCTRCVDALLNYETAKIVHISNKTVGAINRLIQLAIVVYIAVYAIWYRGGYQEIDTATSATTTKLKGVALTNLTQLNISIHGGTDGIRVWDVADYVVPPEENDAFFVTTNVIITPNQTQSRCAEDPDFNSAQCTKDEECPFGVAILNGNGVRTGKCVQSAVGSIKTCEIFAWCPVETNRLPVANKALLEDSQHFTVLIKNYVEFPKFNQKRRNILNTQNSSYLQNCLYNRESEVDRLCPVFSIDTILKEAGVRNFSDISILGGVIVIKIAWDCNLDVDIERCLPDYSFSRLDVATSQIAEGSNFRYASMYEKDGKLYRDLIKAYGIRFIIKVTGRAGKFNIVPLLLNIGSGVGLLAIASVVCDIIVLYIITKRDVYKAKKYLYVDGDEVLPPTLDYDDDEQQSSLTRRTNAGSGPSNDRMSDDDILLAL